MPRSQALKCQKTVLGPDQTFPIRPLSPIFVHEYTVGILKIPRFELWYAIDNDGRRYRNGTLWDRAW